MQPANYETPQQEDSVQQDYAKIKLRLRKEEPSYFVETMKVLYGKMPKVRDKFVVAMCENF